MFNVNGGLQVIRDSLNILGGVNSVASGGVYNTKHIKDEAAKRELSRLGWYGRDLADHVIYILYP